MLKLKAKIRQEKGKKNKKLRKNGFIPAVLYGHKVESLPLAIERRDFEKVYDRAGESSLIKIDLENGGGREQENQKEEKMVFIYDTQVDSVTGKVDHVDFYQAKMDEPITIEVPLEFEGEAPAVKELEGILVKSLQSIEVEALPQRIPHEVKIDISGLKTFDDLIRVKDLDLPEGVETAYDPEETVVSVNPPRSQEELEEIEETPSESLEEIEVEKKGKEEDEAEESSDE